MDKQQLLHLNNQLLLRQFNLPNLQYKLKFNKIILNNQLILLHSSSLTLLHSSSLTLLHSNNLIHLHSSNLILMVKLPLPSSLMVKFLNNHMVNKLLLTNTDNMGSLNPIMDIQTNKLRQDTLLNKAIINM